MSLSSKQQWVPVLAAFGHQLKEHLIQEKTALWENEWNRLAPFNALLTIGCGVKKYNSSGNHNIHTHKHTHTPELGCPPLPRNPPDVMLEMEKMMECMILEEFAHQRSLSSLGCADSQKTLTSSWSLCCQSSLVLPLPQSGCGHAESLVTGQEVGVGNPEKEGWSSTAPSSAWGKYKHRSTSIHMFMFDN